MLADNIQFQFLPVRDSVPCTLLQGLDAQLGEVPDYQYVLVEDVCPADYRAKYKFIQTMKNIGFEFQAALLTYTHGNNVGNLHFVWKVNAPNESSFSLSQPVTKMVKMNIPVYHTRTMRKEMLGIYGCLTPSLKLAALRHIYRVFTGMCAGYTTYLCMCVFAYVCIHIHGTILCKAQLVGTCTGVF